MLHAQMAAIGRELTLKQKVTEGLQLGAGFDLGL